MFKFDTIRNGAVAAFLSVVLTVVAVGAAVGPVEAGQTALAASAQRA